MGTLILLMKQTGHTRPVPSAVMTYAHVSAVFEFLQRVGGLKWCGLKSVLSLFFFLFFFPLFFADLFRSDRLEKVAGLFGATRLGWYGWAQALLEE